MFQFYNFHNYLNLNSGPTGACYQEWKNLGVIVMVAKITLTQTTNYLTTVVVSLLTVNMIKYRFSRLRLYHFIMVVSILQLRCWRQQIDWRYFAASRTFGLVV